VIIMRCGETVFFINEATPSFWGWNYGWFSYN